MLFLERQVLGNMYGKLLVVLEKCLLRYICILYQM